MKSVTSSHSTAPSTCTCRNSNKRAGLTTLLKKLCIFATLTVLLFVLCSCDIILAFTMNEEAHEWRTFVQDTLVDPPYNAMVRPMDCEQWIATVSDNKIYAVATMSFTDTTNIDEKILHQKLEELSKEADKKFPGTYETEFEIYYDSHYDGEKYWLISYKRRCPSVYSMN